MLKRLQSPRMFELGDSASITKSRRASKMEFDVHGMCTSINVVETYCRIPSFLPDAVMKETEEHSPWDRVLCALCGGPVACFR
jgi:hypothetical protein